MEASANIMQCSELFSRRETEQLTQPWYRSVGSNLREALFSNTCPPTPDHSGSH
jgi:hypothetical protein